MNDSEIDGEFRDRLWAECASTATYHDNLIINKDKKKSPIDLMIENRAKGLSNLKKLVKCAWQQVRIKSKEIKRQRNRLCVCWICCKQC
jgi:hypothetical protein